MYKKILVPVDGSPTSTLGLQEAIRLAKDQRAKMQLLHVVDMFIAAQGFEGMTISGELLDSLEDNGKKVLKNAVALAGRHRVKAQPVLDKTVGRRVADLIVDEAKKWNADVIVMGTYGRRGVSHLVLGSDAEAVVRSAPVPVLLVRPARRKHKKRS